VPVFVSSNLDLAAHPQAVGRNQNHLIFRVRQGSTEFKAIAFGRGRDRDELSQARKVSLAHTPRMNFFNGRMSIELHVKDIKIEN